MGIGRVLAAAGLTAALVGSLGLAGVAAGVRAAEAVTHGTAVVPAPPWTAKIYAKIGNGYSGCTGFLVGRRGHEGWVLTADHCVLDDKGDPIPADKFTVVIGRTDLTDANEGKQFGVREVREYPGFSLDKDTIDAAVLLLDGPLPAWAKPLPLAPSGYSVADSAYVNAYGYGCQAETFNDHGDSVTCEQSDFLRRTRQGSYHEDTECDEPSSKAPELYCFGHLEESFIAHGDSGGPWVTSTADPFAAGLSSRLVDFHAKQYHHVLATNLSVPRVHSWITRNAEIFQGLKDTIYADAESKAAWLFEADGFRHPIPSASAYKCLVRRGAIPVEINSFDLAELPPAPAPAECGTSEALVKVSSAGQGAVLGPDGRVWIMSDKNFDYGYTAVDPQTMAVHVYTPKNSSSYQFARPAFDGGRGVWGALYSFPAFGYIGFSRYVPATGAFKIHKIPPACTAEINNNGGVGVVPASDGSVWAQCSDGITSTVIVRITATGQMTTFKPPKSEPVLGRLTPGPGGEMWAVPAGISGGGGVVKFTPNGHSTFYPDYLGLYDASVIGDGSGHLYEIGICPRKLTVWCVETVAADGTRSIINQIPDQPATNGADYGIDRDGNLWIWVGGTDGGHVKTGNYFYEVAPSGKATVHAFKAPTTFVTVGPAAITSDGAIWLDTNAGYLFRIDFG